MGNNPSTFKGPKKPVENVSWEDCQAFIDKLNETSGSSGAKFNFPTEAQCEYACRAGTTSKFRFGDDEGMLGDYAWFYGNSGGRTHPVGEKKPNAWGLHDMHGNVWGWCADWYSNTYYATSTTDDPIGSDSGPNRVLRGGSWYSRPSRTRSANRYGFTPVNRSDGIGFRVSRTP